MIKGAKSIAEYAIRKWLESQGFVMEFFDLKICGNEGILTDSQGESMALVYHSDTKSVSVKQ